MEIPITGLYTGLIIILVIVLAIRIALIRGQAGISIYHGGNTELGLRIRQHGNAVEIVPLALLAMAIIEVNGASELLLHGLGITLVIARILHPVGLKTDVVLTLFRAIGIFSSFGVMLIAGAVAIWQYLQ